MLVLVAVAMLLLLLLLQVCQVDVVVAVVEQLRLQPILTKTSICSGQLVGLKSSFKAMTLMNTETYR